ncbi:hypothetical protein SGLAM104S_09309 [Streptomyces glaucescens]
MALRSVELRSSVLSGFGTTLERSDRLRLPIRNWTRPSAMPSAASAKPRCQLTFWPTVPMISGAAKAPRLMPM